MTNIRKNTKNNKETNLKYYNLSSIYAQLSKDPFALITLLQKHKGLSFQKVGKRYVCNEHTGIKIEPVKSDQSKYTLSNYSAGIEIPKGQIKNLLFHLTEGLNKADQAKSQYQILVECGLISDSGIIRHTTPQISPNNKKTSKHTNSSAKEAKKPVFVDWATPYGQKVFSFLHKKTGATIELLQKYNVHPTTSPNQIRYSYQVGETIKAKNISRSKKQGKYYTYQHQESYIFGLEQLPARGEFLIVASGEDDTLCINQNLNQFGIYAICGWNEKQPLQTEPLNSLKKRFKNIYLLSDNDNKKVAKISQKIAQKSKLVWLDTISAKRFFSIENQSDICDIFGYQRSEGKKELLKEFILHLIGSNTRISKYKDDPFSIAVPHCYKVHFDQYIGQSKPNQFGVVPVESIKQRIAENHRLIIQSLAGTGKSTLVKMLIHQGELDKDKIRIPDLEFFKSIGIDKVVILEPTTAINNQLFLDFKKEGLACGQLDSTITKFDEETAQQSSVVFCCYDSFIKMSLDLSKTAIIVDEYHQLVNDFSFRHKERFTYLIEKISNAKRSIFLSATPNYLFTLPSKIHSAFGYKLLKGIPSTKNQLEVQPIIYDGKQKDITTYITENREEKGLTTVKYDSKTNIDAIVQSLEMEGKKCDRFYSGSPKGERKENNENYQSIMEHGRLTEQLDFLFYTTLMEAGVSIKDRVTLNAIVDCNSWQKFIQLASRARYNKNTGANQLHKVWVFRSEDSIKKEPQNYSNNKGVIEQLKDYLSTANKLSNLSNDMDREIKELEQHTFNTKTDESNLKILHSRNTKGIFEPCILGILNILYQKEQKAPFALFLERIKRFDNRVQIKPIKTEKLTEHEELEEIRASQKVDKEIASKEFLECLNSDFNMTVEAVCYLDKKGSFKRFIRSVLETNTPLKRDIIEFISKHEKAFQGKSQKRVIGNIAKIIYNNRSIAKQKVVNTVLNNDPKRVEQYISVLNQQRRTSALYVEYDNVAGYDKYNNARYTNIKKEVAQLNKDINRNRRGEWVKSSTIKQMVNRAGDRVNKMITAKAFPKLSDNQAVRLLRGIYHVDSLQIRRGKKRFWEYQIGDPISSDFDTFFLL